MNRKKFLINSSLAVFSVSIFGKVQSKDNDFEGDCETTNDILGPFYRPEVPVRSDLTSKDLQGTIVELKGQVFGSDCKTPLNNAKVEIWHCNTDGEYDNDSEGFHQRGKWYSDEDGHYSFKTILPGKYLNGGKFRPAHIHFRVTAKGSQELISQIYFHGDPHITKDPWASKNKAIHRILPISLEDTKGNLVVVFDIFLKDI
ncbi:MAG: twin-arginine translocation pathway signal protein [Saprospiraceae bacterium]